MRRLPTLGSGILLVGILTLGSAPAQGSQGAAPPGGTLAGSVVSADGSEPLEGADVVLVPAGQSFAGWATPSTLPPGAMYRLTQADGSYSFEDVDPGVYRLHVQRIGYHAAVLEVDLSEEAALRLSVGLVIAPILLSPVEVEARRDAYNRDMSFMEEIEDGRIGSERWRQDIYLGSEVRALTHTDVIEAITLGEQDVFRALHRAPGVSSRDDWTSELWVRGATWGLTSVYFDGLPLYNPVHNGGLISAISAEAVGAVLLHPGVRSASVPGGAAGVLDIQSRAAAGHGDLRGYAGTSLTTFSFAIQKRLFDEKFGAAIAMRTSEDTDGTLLPWIGNSGKKRVQGGIGQLPDDFFDLVGHLDLELDRERSLEISGIWEQDRIRQTVAGGPKLNDMQWGNLAGRATLQLPIGGSSLRQTAGFSRFSSVVRQEQPRSPLAAFEFPPTQQPTESAINYFVLSGELERRGALAGGEGWRGGYQLSHQTVDYLGAPTAPYPIQTHLRTILVDDDVTVGALWAERRWKPAQRLTLQTGLRLETSDGLGEDWGMALAPRISARYSLKEDLSLSAGLGRTYQYMHTVAPSGLRVGPRLVTSHIRVLAGEEGASAIRADIATLGAEYWLSRSWLAAANVYLRYATNLAISDPTPGSIDDHRFKVNASNVARGLELSARRLAGRWTASFAYTLAASDLEAGGLSFPSPSDRTHAFDATFTSRFPKLLFGGSMRFGSAVSAASGTPYTRVHPGTYKCDTVEVTCQPIVSNTAGQPNAERADWSSRLDLLVDWTREFKAWQLGFYFEVQNVGNWDRAVTYAVNQGDCRRTSPSDAFCDARLDEFVPGVSTVQTVGVRVGF